MFTGLIVDVGTVRSVDTSKGDPRYVLATALPAERLALGASIACDGCCLTVVDAGPGWFAVDVSAETLSKTTLSGWREGRGVNLEPSLRLGDDLGGHLVSGHVDGLAEVLDVRPDGDSHRFRIRLPDAFARFLAPKGSIALNGVSLTVNEVEGSVFGINIIPHTWTHTTFRDLNPGDALNLEVDMLARYVARILGAQ